MKRRDFLTHVGATAALAALSHVALAQQKVPRIVFLYRAPPTDFIATYLAPGLADLGLVNGRDLIIDAFWAPTDADLPEYAARIVASRPDLIITAATAPSLAVRDATKTIPVVFFGVGDPVAIGLVPSLAHPGGNMTGFTNLAANFIGNQVMLLKDLVPSLGRFAVPYFPADPITPLYLPQLQSVATQLGIEPVLVELIQGPDYGPQFDRVFATGAAAVLQLTYGELNNASTYDLMYDLYLQHRMPVQSASNLQPQWATPFYGLIQYATNAAEIQRGRVSAAVVSILKGAKPADIPVELPTIFDLAVNTWMAKQIGVTVPTSILARATLVIDYDIRAPKGSAK